MTCSLCQNHLIQDNGELCPDCTKAMCNRCGGLGMVVDARKNTFGRSIPCPTCSPHQSEPEAPVKRDAPVLTHEALVARLDELESKYKHLEFKMRKLGKVKE